LEGVIAVFLTGAHAGWFKRKKKDNWAAKRDGRPGTGLPRKLHTCYREEGVGAKKGGVGGLRMAVKRKKCSGKTKINHPK